MDEIELTKKILSEFDSISVCDIREEYIIFSLNSNVFGIHPPSFNDISEQPVIFLINDGHKVHPHFMLSKIEIDNVSVQGICLYESNELINHLSTFEEKINNILNRLIRLLSLGALEIEKEYQKEFLYYWNIVADGSKDYFIYLGQNREFGKMNAYSKDDTEIRIVANGIKLNDKDKTKDDKPCWVFIRDLPFFYIPIIDNRRILPPTKAGEWSSEHIKQIIQGKSFQSISHKTFEKIKGENIKGKAIGIVFEMIVNTQSIIFCCLITFNHKANDSLFSKLQNDILSVQPIKGTLTDYYHLCVQTGNDTTLINQNILLVGVGSLGSYIAEELIKSGLRTLTICDGDKFEFVNIPRHRLGSWWNGWSKVAAMKFRLEMIHPEINIDTIEKNIDCTMLEQKMNDYDMIIFAVGSSDIQLSLNDLLIRQKYPKPVLYVWLEAGGEYSHILYVNCQEQGCFQCLYTNKSGQLVNIKVNHFEEHDLGKMTIRNGCGATRVPYGNQVLLRTTSEVLSTVKKVFNGEYHSNTLIDISPSRISYDSEEFVESKCKCCGS